MKQIATFPNRIFRFYIPLIACLGIIFSFSKCNNNSGANTHLINPYAMLSPGPSGAHYDTTHKWLDWNILFYRNTTLLQRQMVIKNIQGLVQTYIDNLNKLPG